MKSLSLNIYEALQTLLLLSITFLSFLSIFRWDINLGVGYKVPNSLKRLH